MQASENLFCSLKGGEKSPVKKNGGVAQLEEHLLCKQGVDSSSLFISTKVHLENNRITEMGS